MHQCKSMDHVNVMLATMKSVAVAEELLLAINAILLSVVEAQIILLNVPIQK